MRPLKIISRALPLLVACAPFSAYGQATQTVSMIVGFFNIFVGLMLTAAILTFTVGFIMWCTRLGTWPSYRTEAVKVMEWSVVILFVLVVILAIVQFFQNHSRTASYIISFIIIVAIIWIIVVLAADSEGGEKKEEKKPVKH